MNPDASDNREHYYLADVSGGNIGLWMDDDGDPDTERQAVFQHFDAFGNRMTSTMTPSGMFGWRGQEGSVSDRDSGLVYMQSRHYDPTLGRFIQADALAIAGFSTQALNRYIYCANDPVNHSDPTGRVVPAILGLLGPLLFGFGVWLGVEVGVVASGGHTGPLLNLISMILGVLGGEVVGKPCLIGLQSQLLRIIALADAGLLTAEAFATAFSATLWAFVGGIIMAGFIVGFGLGTLFASVEPPYESNSGVLDREDEHRSSSLRHADARRARGDVRQQRSMAHASNIVESRSWT